MSNSSSCTNNPGDKSCWSKIKCPYTAMVLRSLPAIIISVIMSVAILFAYVYKCSDKMFEKFIMNNPEKIIESVQKLGEKKQAEYQKEATEKAKNLSSQIISDDRLPYIGNKSGKKVAIQFYDYSCGYCKKMAEELRDLTTKDSDVKVILIDYPIFGQNSTSASKASIYVFKKYPDKFAKFYFKLIGEKNITPSVVLSTAKSVGIDENIVKNSDEDKAIEEILRANYMSGSEIRIEGTPVVIANDKVHFGYVEASKLF